MPRDYRSKYTNVKSFEEQPVKVQDFKKNTYQVIILYRKCLKLMKKHWNITPCNRLDLKALGIWLSMPKIAMDTELY